MTAMFDRLMQGLEEARAYMEGERKDYRVTIPAEVEISAASGSIHKQKEAPVPNHE
jgi:putative transcriptional regulator